MKLVKRVKCKLQVNTEQAAVLLETLQRFALACNDILSVSQENRTTNKVRLQHLCYREIKGKYGLQANLVIRAIARVSEALKKKPKQFKPTSMNLDQRTFSFNEKRWEVSISTAAGRLNLPLAIGDFQRNLLAGHKPTSAILYFNKRKKEFYISIALSREVPVPSKDGNVVGVDRGIYNLAVTSNGLEFSGRQAIHVRRRYAKLREALQTKGTKGAKRLLKRLSGKEHRWMADLNHAIPASIVRDAAVLTGTTDTGTFSIVAPVVLSGHADIIAADNIRQVYLGALAEGFSSVDTKAATSSKPTTSVVSN